MVGKKSVFSKSCPIFAKDSRHVQYFEFADQSGELWVLNGEIIQNWPLITPNYL